LTTDVRYAYIGVSTEGKTMTHTPGPWAPWLAAKADGKRGKLGVWEIKSAADVEAGFAHRNIVGEASGLTEKEARLIAAAPELLGALKAVLITLKGKPGLKEGDLAFMQEKVRAAIAKAEGK
jgi:hypothetical protein